MCWSNHPPATGNITVLTSGIFNKFQIYILLVLWACYLNAGLLVNNPACWGFTDEYKQNNRLSQIKYKIKFWSSISFLLNFSSFYGSFRQMIPRILGIYDTVTEGTRYYFYSKNYLLNSGRNKSGNISIHTMNFRFEMTIIIDHW